MADVFISYSSVNKDAANAICHVLEENGVRCWIAPRDILQGFDYGDVIEKAIRSCKLFVLVYSKTAAVSPWVKGEVNIAFTEGKTILPYRIDETLLDGGLRVMLNQYHWIDSYPDYKMRFKDLLTSVKANLGQSEEYRHIPKPQPTTPKPTPTPAPKPNYLKYILGVLAVVLGIVIGVVLTNNEPAVETIAEEAATEEVLTETSYREEQERLAEEQRKREQEEAPHKQRNSRTQQSSVYTVNGVTFTMIAVQGGTYTMGATSEQGSDAWDDEKPAHKETVSDFMIGETEVTQELWQAVMGSNPSRFTGDLQRPVEEVSWDDCQTFIRKLNQLTGQNFRLPSEAEWEYAARGGNQSQGYKYSGGNTVGTVAWYDGNSGNTTHRVKTKQPNELGIYDMSGNVWEWCQDKWCSDYNSPRNSGYRVLRGGSWNFNARYVRVSYRSYGDPDYHFNILGLRLAF